MKMRKLPESELEIMIALWEADGPVPRNYFDRKLKERKKLGGFYDFKLVGQASGKRLLVQQQAGKPQPLCAACFRRGILGL